MNIYRQLIENPLFYKWIYHPSPEINNYWEHYLRNHSQNAAIIREFKAGFEAHLNYVDHRLSYKEKEELAIKIIQQLEQRQKDTKRRKLIRLTLRYAAVAILFLFIGGALSYLIYEQQSQQHHFVEIPPVSKMNLDEPTLIFDNKKEISLNRGKSELEYNAEGELLLNREKIDVQANEQEHTHQVHMNTLVIPYGNTSTITLSDGTKVWLNAGSRLIYPSKFVDGQREVFFVGEAYFHVTRNEEQPFLVKTPEVVVKVLGTQFNMSAYSDDNVVQTVLAEGSIELSRPNASLFEQSTTVKPGQLATLNKTTRETRLYNVNTEYYTSWKEGYLTFNNSDLSRVVKKLERYYNIRFRYNDPLNGSIKISGKLDVTNNKEIVFKYMNSLTGLNFTKINEKLYLIE